MLEVLKNAFENRRSYYNITNQSPISDDEIKDILNNVILHTPSAFNSQTTRMVLLLGDEHKKLWSMVKETLRKVVPADKFDSTDKKIDSFSAGYGSVLFLEDSSPLDAVRDKFSTYADKFDDWSNHTSGMHQFAVWTMLEAAGFGVSLQHYNTLIDDEVKETWNLDKNWKLIAQMPFGLPVEKPGPKEFLPVENRLFVFE